MADSARRLRHDLSALVLESLLESNDDPVFSVDEAYRYTSFNASHAQVMKALYGVDISVGASMLECQTVPEDRLAAQRNLDRSLAGERLVEEAFSGEKTRTRRYFEVVHTPIQSDGRVVGVVVQARDVSERRRAEAELRETSDFLENLLDHASAPVIVWDPELRITRFNHAFEELTQRRAETVIGRHLELLFPMDHRRTQALAHVTSATSGRRWEAVEIPILRADGDIRTVLWNSATICGPDGVTPMATIAQGQDITDRLAVEQALRDREEHYRLLADYATDVLFVLDAASQTFRYASPSVERVLGYSSEECAGMSIRDLLTPASLAFVESVTPSRIESTLRGGGDIFTDALEVTRKDGCAISVDVNVHFRLNPATGLVEGTGVMRDVTERKRSQDELALNALQTRVLLELYQRSTAPLNDVLDFAVDASLQTTQSQLSFVGLMNQEETVLTVHGWSQEAMSHCAVGARTLEFPITTAGLWADSVRTRGPVVVNDYRAAGAGAKGLPAGHLPIRRFLSVPILDDSRIVAVATVANKPSDYTDTDVQALTSLMSRLWEIVRRKQTDEKLRMQARIANVFLTVPDEEMFNEVLRVVLDVMESPLGVFGYLDEEGALVVPTMTRQVWDKCRIPGKPTRFPRETWGDSSWPRAIREKRASFTNELSRKVPQGHVPAERHVTVPIVFQGESVGVFQVANKPTDYTEADVRALSSIAEQVAPLLSARLGRQRAQDDLRRLNADLEQRVLERTAALDAANKELEAFAYSVSHDLRAPLRHISGFAHVLQEVACESLDEEGRDCLDTIDASVHEMGQLIDDLLQFSRTGRASLSISEVDMDQVLNEVLQAISQGDADGNVEWTVGPLPRVMGDHALLRQVWVNLLDNALKYSRAKSPAHIEVGTRRDDAVGEDVFWVRDDGVGFDMQYSDKLFTVFQRLHAASEFEGTGIGLANVKRIITRLGGRVWANGELDSGATFYFSLPHRKETVS
jgi:PAS domain S-box-containing protein